MINSHLEPELLSAYIDDEVSAAERREVEAHLNTCQECRQELDSLRWTVNLLREVPAVEVPRPFYVREADLAPAEQAEPSWLDQLAAFVGTFRLLSYASAASFALILLLTVAGALPTGFGSAGGTTAQPAADTRMMQRAPAEGAAAPAEEPAMEMQAESTQEESAEAAGDVGIQQEPAPTAADTDGEAQIAAVPEAEATQPPQVESAEAPESAAMDEQQSESPQGAGGEAPAITTERPLPQPASESQSLLNRIGLSGWLLLITGLGTLIFGGLARWLPNN